MKKLVVVIFCAFILIGVILYLYKVPLVNSDVENPSFPEDIETQTIDNDSELYSFSQIEELYNDWRNEQIQLELFCDRCEPTSFAHGESGKPQFALPPFQNINKKNSVGYATIDTITADYNNDKIPDYLFEINVENCDRGSAHPGLIYLLFLSENGKYYIGYSIIEQLEKTIENYINKRANVIADFDNSRNILSAKKKCHNVKIKENYIIRGDFDIFLDSNPSCCPSLNYTFAMQLDSANKGIMRIYNKEYSTLLETLEIN